MSDLKRTKGDALTATLWNKVVDRLEESRAGFPFLQELALRVARNSSVIAVNNTSGTDRDVGDVMRLAAWDGPTSFRDAPENLALTIGSPTWHTEINNLCVIVTPTPNGERGLAVANGCCVARMSSNTSDDYVMIDPASTNEVKATDAGIASLLGILPGTSAPYYGTINLGDQQRLWRYRLNEDSQAPAVTDADLMSLGGVEFSNDINLSDPLSYMADQVSGNTGMCIQTGNKFHAIQAVC